MNLEEQHLMWLTPGFVRQEIVIYAGEGFEIVGKTEDGGKHWEMVYKELQQ